MRIIAGVLVWMVGMVSAFAMTCTQVSGFSSFSCVVDEVARTITLTETISGSQGIVSLLFDCPGGDDDDGPWQITKTVTNGTGTAWVNVDNELMTGCDIPCQVDDNTCNGDRNGTFTYCSSTNFDFLSFNQANPLRVLDSTDYSTVDLDENAARDFAQFDNCSPITDTPPCGNDTCCDLGAAANTVSPGGDDLETFPILSSLAGTCVVNNVRLVQTWNFGITPEALDEWGWVRE